MNRRPCEVPTRQSIAISDPEKMTRAKKAEFPQRSEWADGAVRVACGLFLTAAFAIGLYCAPAFAQTADQGAIVGVVTDSSGAVIANANVTLTDVDTGLVLKAKSNSTGDYYFAPIKTGNYTVSASAPNFQTTEEQNIVVHVTDRLNIPLALKPGRASETVSVTSAAPIMQTQTAEAAVDIDSQFLNDAPLGNRNWIFIAQEAPGSTPFVGRGSGNGDFSSDGQHAEQNNFMLDGVDNNVANADYINGYQSNVVPPPDAIAEFKMETSNYSAEIGRGHGAVVNATTKSGTNAIHGDVWEYVRNTAFDALVWTQQPGSAPAPFHLNQFGATLGGPIIKNKLFFFGDVQESRYSIGATPSTYTVPTPRMRQGDFSELLNPALTQGSCPTVLYIPNTNTGTYSCKSNAVSAGPTGTLQQSGSQQYTEDGYMFAPGQNVFGPGQIDKVAQSLMQAYPCPNYSPAGTGNFGQKNGGWTTTPGQIEAAGQGCNATSDTDMGATNSNYQVDLNELSDPLNWDGKLDWNISSKDLATFRVDYQHTFNTYVAPLGPILDGIGSNQGHTQNYLSDNFEITETHTFSPTLINVFTYAYNWGNWANLQYNADVNISAQYGLNGVPFNAGPQNGGLPVISGSYQSLGAHGNDPAHETQDVFQILDTVTKVWGNNSVKMGFEAMPMRFASEADGTPRGDYGYASTFTSVTGLGGPSGYAGADWLGLATAGTQNVAPASPSTYLTTDNMASGSISTYIWQHYVHQYMAGFIQDDWKTTQKLTLNIGLRYEYFTPQIEQSDQFGNFVQETEQMTPNGGTGSAVLELPISQQSVKLASNLSALLAADHVQVEYNTNRHLLNFPKADWSPRLGASYSIDNKTVVRVGAGVFMGSIEPGGGSSQTQNPPYVMNASLASLPGCTEGEYCESQNAFGNTLENGFSAFTSEGIAQFASFPSIEQSGEGTGPVMNMPYNINYNLGVERAIDRTTSATVYYVGSIGRHLVTLLNNPDQPLAITIGGESGNGFTPFPHFSGAQWMEWEGGSSYNALQVVVRRTYGHGLSALGTYTWGHALDNTIDLLGGDYPTYKQSYLIPIKYEWGQSGYDIRQRAVINLDYDLPVGVGREWLNHPGVLDKIIGGWRTDMEWWGQTGEPFSVGINRISGFSNANGGESNSAIKIANPFKSNLTAPAADVTGGNPLTQSGITTGASSNTAADVCAAQTKTRARWVNPCAFEDPLGVGSSNNAASAALLAPYETGTFSYASNAIGADNALCDGLGCSTTPGSSGVAVAGTPVPYVTGYAAVAPFFGSAKNEVAGPGNWRLNGSLMKDFRVWREQYLEFRADAFNVLNHPSFGNPSMNTTIGANSVQLTGTGSNQTNTIDARYFQLSGKYVF
jgi:Carboxypeptidase regulatory-like domain